MQTEQLQLALRPRPAMEALDLGLRLTQQHMRLLLRLYAPIAAVVGGLCLLGLLVSPWLPGLLLVLLQPWLDRVLLQVFSRAVFGLPSRLADVLNGPLLFRPSLLPGLLVAAFSPWRAFTQPVAQLEGLKGDAARQRRKRLLNGQHGRAITAQLSWGVLTYWLLLGLLWLLFSLNPFSGSDNPMLRMGRDSAEPVIAVLQVLVSLLLEAPFVAGGFMMYLNRRVELESWDVEQELRHAFAH
ncbi:hypothetical protein LRH25_22110 [Ideonella azotifigens]|uniref:DUF4129 domain-containing protein n=1 Tax=Ideonella azotifigens TaxID=513160 RepID=A0ABP3VKT3_9BURK|nr:hypothetical protein [Ideonella azotifigens]MCD2343027.1 hypothetical protein [Ideonella azotifigens]